MPKMTVFSSQGTCRVVEKTVWLFSLLVVVFVRVQLCQVVSINPIFGLQLLVGTLFSPIVVSMWGASNILLFDGYMGQLGAWTAVTGIAYGAIGFLSPLTRKNVGACLLFTVCSTIMYDLVTATSGPLFFGQPWSGMLMGQIPFTAYHLLSNVVSALSVYALLRIFHYEREHYFALEALKNYLNQRVFLWNQ